MRLLPSLLVVLLLAISAGPAHAHPGIGIVVDRAGNVFYTDLVHVWRIAPDGRKSIAVRDVHTHELALDGTGTLYGEDSRYQGGDRWKHRIWRRTPDGRVHDVIPWRDGFWPEFGFVHDAAGAMYWIRCARDTDCTVQRRARDGRTTVIRPARGGLRDRPVNIIAASRRAGLFVIDGGALRLLTLDGRVSTRAPSLGSMPMGLWVAEQDTVYAAVYGRRAVVRVDPAGRVTEVARTPAPWGPSGVTRAPNGDLWILEYSTSNEARVRRITPRGAVTVY